MALPARLYKTTIVIWSDYDGADVELHNLAYQAEEGDAYCTRQDSELVTNPADFPGTDFFGTDDEPVTDSKSPAPRTARTGEMIIMSDPRTLAGFLARHDPEGTRVVADITPVRDGDGNSPLVIVRHGRFAAVLALMPFSSAGEHLCINVHAFADGEQATAGAFGMTTGRRHELPATGTTSHGFNSASLVAVLIGEQGLTEPAASTSGEDGYRAAVLAHEHHYAGQLLRHAHKHGDLPHGYFEHPEDTAEDRPEDHWRSARGTAGQDERYDADGQPLAYGRCDTCGAPCSADGCTADAAHATALSEQEN